MKTEELVAFLAAGTTPVRPQAAARRFAVALGGGGLAAIALMVVLLGVNPALAQLTSLPVLWVKLAFVVALLFAGMTAALRSSTPGRTLGPGPGILAAALIAMWAFGAAALLAAEPEARAALVFGQTWKVCAFRIAGLALPLLVAILWAMRGLAPTQLRLAGAAAGLFAGAAGALVYAFHCPELAAPFLGVWYVLGILIPAAFGALIGPRVLRW